MDVGERNGTVREIIRVVMIVLVSLLVGSWFDAATLTALVALLVYIGWGLTQLSRINRWLLSGKDKGPTRSNGAWGVLLDRIHHLRKRSARDQQELQSMIDYLRSSLSSLSDATVMLDQDGNIEWCNRAASVLMGLREPGDNGQHLTNLLRHPDFIRYFESRNYAEPLEMQAPTNASVRLSVNITWFGRGNRLLFARDVTRNYRLEQMRRDFVANASHELRTPLTVISGYLDTFVSQDQLEPKWKRACEQMLQQSKRMQNLVQDLMLLSRLESVPRSAEYELLSLTPLADMIKEEIEAAAVGDRDIRIDIRSDRCLRGDGNELRSAFSNLAVNAARYTKDGDRITLRWFADADHAIFEVEDSGIGIEPQHIPRLTERFYRVDEGRSADTGGTGLGLAIVKHILRRHNAELKIRSTPGQGSTFSCIFPLALTHEPRDNHKQKNVNQKVEKA